MTGTALPYSGILRLQERNDRNDFSLRIFTKWAIHRGASIAIYIYMEFYTNGLIMEIERRGSNAVIWGAKGGQIGSN
jgi:hypothetical protein